MASIILGNLKKIEGGLKITKNLPHGLLFFCCNANGNSEGNKHRNGIPIPPEPTSCCMSGCPNCVWIKYAQELAQMFDDGDEIAKNKIMEKVTDPSMRAFLLMQLGLEDSKK